MMDKEDKSERNQTISEMTTEWVRYMGKNGAKERIEIMKNSLEKAFDVCRNIETALELRGTSRECATILTDIYPLLSRIEYEIDQM